MLVLGLLLIAGATAVTVGALFDGGESATVEILGRSIETTIAGVFAVGAATMLVFLVGVWALMASMGRARRKRAERKEAKARERESVAQLEEERAELRAENERLSERLSDQPADRPATTPSVTGTTGSSTSLRRTPSVKRTTGSSTTAAT